MKGGWLGAIRRRLGRKHHDQFQLSLPFFGKAAADSAPSATPVAAVMAPAQHSSLCGTSRRRGWSAQWGVPDLRREVRLEISHRMRSSLGGFYARDRVIRIADTLLEAPPHLLHEVLCHEAAHAAVEILHGGRARSHGREWRELMRRVGLEPRVHVPGAELGQRVAARRAQAVGVATSLSALPRGADRGQAGEAMAVPALPRGRRRRQAQGHAGRRAPVIASKIPTDLLRRTSA